ncbi:hypothetical protein [Ralstonia sp. UBA689]|uniref:hypothetical protein n=1 Tax=Ralstonia sp. UBA689 TaxID=1947373 RepID=UPI0025CEC0AF|nr:hypothetical protein [Ralstonia sp. UBA689]
MTIKSPAAHGLLMAAALLLGAQAAHADSDTCGRRASSIVRKAYPNAKPSGDHFVLDGLNIETPESDMNGEVAHVVCRTWPGHPDVMLAAIPFTRDWESKEPGGHLELLVLDKRSLNVKQRLRLNTNTTGSGLSIKTIRFDNTRYTLAPGQAAVGLLMTRGRQVDPKTFSEDVLWLYALEGDQVKPVVDGLVMLADTTVMAEQCSTTSVGGRRTLSVDPSAHSGYADIVVTEKRLSRRETKGKDGMCEMRPTKSETATHRLIYSGAQYDVPSALLKPLE